MSEYNKDLYLKLLEAEKEAIAAQNSIWRALIASVHGDEAGVLAQLFFARGEADRTTRQIEEIQDSLK